MEPLDLTLAPPRSVFAELDGLMLLPRTIDKFRGTLPGGKLGGYYPTNGPILGISGFLLQRLGVTEDDFRAAVAAAQSEDDVARWLRGHVDASIYAEINATLRRLKIKHAQDEAVFREIYADALAADPQLEYILDIVEADDRLMFGDVA